MAELEQVLLKLLIPDNAVIKQVNKTKLRESSVEICLVYAVEIFRFQATAELREAFKNPAVVQSLISVLSSSQNPQV